MKCCAILVALTLFSYVQTDNNVIKLVTLQETLRRNVENNEYQGNDRVSRVSQKPKQVAKPQHTASSATTTDATSSTCGYENCPTPKHGMLNVHMVAHTHDDVGWIRTVDQYYYQEVQYILDSVVSELQKHPQRRFIYVEVAFFYRWWRQQDDSLRHILKRLVNEGRLEFILGGWCMNDEASTHYNAIIDQHTLGFRFLQDNFGDCGRPRVGWQIDPFGHSREQASLFAQFGFDGLFFGRLDYQDKAARQKQKTMEMLWQGSPNNLGDQGVLLTGVNYNGYNPPSGFCFDQTCDDFIQDDERMEDYNKNAKVKDFIKIANEQAKSYSTNQIMMTMGSDFQFQNGHKNFKNLDKLIAYVNEAQEHGSMVNAFYSTPSCYLKALHEANQTYTTKEDDFFPYAHRSFSFWTGYFTSRAALKGYARTANNFFQACKQLDALTQLNREYSSNLKIDVLREALGVVQHHDGISGTEKQVVAYDYAKKLAKGMAECEDVINFAYAKLIARGTGVIPNQTFCPLLNVSSCSITEATNKFTVLLYNPIARPLTHWVRVPVTGTAYTVTDANNKPISSQVVPLSAATLAIPDHKGSKATGDLVFNAKLPPLGFTTFFVFPAAADSRSTLAAPEPVAQAVDVVIENQHLRLTFDGISGLLRQVTNKDDSLTTVVTQELRYYRGVRGNNSRSQDQASGAYVFRPQSSTTDPITSKATLTVLQSAGMQEVRQVFGTWASQVVRLYDGAQHAEIEFTIGPIPISDGVGREVVSQFTSDLNTNGIFYTDANGREVLKRVRDYRPTWNLNQTEPVAGNYYPVNSRIYIKDDTREVQLTVLTDRSQGGASIKDGQLELMLHRRTMDDDGLGVGEALNETGITGRGLVIRGTHYLLFGSSDKAASLHRDLAERLYMAPIASFSALSSDPAHYITTFNTQWSGVKTSLPDNVHLLSLEQWRGRTLLLRLEHFYEQGEDSVHSTPTPVTLKNLFTPFPVLSATELTLGANQELSSARRLPWKLAGRATNGDMSSFVIPVDPETMTVVLKPMQIRTFQISVG